jgi:hypothetical protein
LKAKLGHAEGAAGSNAENYDPSDCHKATARGYRVYAPGQTRAFYLERRHTACHRDRHDSVRPVVKGSRG